MAYGQILFWSGFGVAVRVWQLGLQLTGPFAKGHRWQYALFAGAGAGFGYWLESVGARQDAVLAERKQALLEKRARVLGQRPESENGAVAAAKE